MTQEVLKLALEALEPFTTPNWAGSGVDKCNEAITAIKEALAQPEQEPVIDKSAAIRIATALGWTPPRTWVGLTDDEIWEAYMESPVELNCTTDDLYAFSRIIEAKLKEKNT
jgi:hypothetical protein